MVVVHDEVTIARGLREYWVRESCAVEVAATSSDKQRGSRERIGQIQK
jgi:hypothetical protein